MSVAFSADATRPGRDDGRAPLTVVDDESDLPDVPGDDAALVGRCRRGESDAYAALFRRWFNPCRAAAVGILGGDDAALDAEDVAQEALVAAWARLEQLREAAAFGPWACQIARNLARDHLKRRRPLVQPLHGLGEEHLALVRETDDPQRIVGARERDRLVRVAAGSLRGREGAAFERVVDEGLEPRQVAAALGVSGNNAYQILFRLRGRMHSAVRGAMVWRSGRPRCPELARLADGADPSFTPRTAATVARHIRRCPVCTQEADLHAGPAQLLSSSFVAVLLKWAHLPLRLRPDEAAASAQGLDLAVRVGAGVGVATTLTASVLAVTGAIPVPSVSGPQQRPAARSASAPGGAPAAPQVRRPRPSAPSPVAIPAVLPCAPLARPDAGAGQPGARAGGPGCPPAVVGAAPAVGAPPGPLPPSAESALGSAPAAPPVLGSASPASTLAAPAPSGPVTTTSRPQQSDSSLSDSRRRPQASPAPRSSLPSAGGTRAELGRPTPPPTPRAAQD